MLYDPKWQKPGTKADPLTLPALIAWLEKQPPTKRYCFADTGACLLHQYLSAHGFGPNDGKELLVGGDTFNERAVGGDWGDNIPLPLSFQEVAQNFPHTFGGALERARELR